jgi:hypothetical protein
VQVIPKALTAQGGRRQRKQAEERIERDHHEEPGSRKAMGGNDHWESRHWKTRSSSPR